MGFMLLIIKVLGSMLLMIRVDYVVVDEKVDSEGVHFVDNVGR